MKSKRIWAVLLIVFLCGAVWLLGVGATVWQPPFEEPASSVKTPNPSKAPWYFVGLQELLVYIDPWLAGVLPPILVILIPLVGISLAIFCLIRVFTRR